MRNEAEREFEWRRNAGWPIHHSHHHTDLQEYQNDLARLGEFPTYSENTYQVYRLIYDMIKTGLPYKHFKIAKSTSTSDIDTEHLAIQVRNAKIQAGLEDL